MGTTGVTRKHAIVSAAALLGLWTMSVTLGAQPGQERDFLSRVRRLTVEGKRAGEGYWAPDGKRLVFQSERERGNQAHFARHGQDHVRVLPSRQRRNHVRVDSSRSEFEEIPGR